MSLNWREIELIVKELPFEGSALQGVVQHDFHSLSWSFYHPEHGRWTLYTEIGTPYSRLHMATRAVAVQQMGKTAKLQRFIQFCRANLEGSKVVSVEQMPYDRCLLVKLNNHEHLMCLYFRFYSGPGANIIITEEDDTILELLYRRPARDEKSGARFVLPPNKETDDLKFQIRMRTDTSFNRQIEEEYGKASNEQTLSDLRNRVERKKEKILKELEATANSHKRNMLESGKFNDYKRLADLLSANVHLLTAHETSLSVQDWESETIVTIPLDPKLRPNENITRLYDRFQKAKGSFENAKTEYAKAEAELLRMQEKYERLLAPSDNEKADIQRLKRELGNETADKITPVQSPGLTLHSGQFTLLVGRNAKENDELLRHWVKGNDYWMHTRDCPGGYVFIKNLKEKTVPLEVLLDAANLALVFSKAKNQGRADLYYTQVKYLRRTKGGKTGLVIPTQEKNLTVVLDESRLARLLLEDDHA